MASSCVIADAMTKVAMVDPDLADRLLAKHDGQVVRFEHDEVA
jgi:thiamine biosynthesis lipoprotein